MKNLSYRTLLTAGLLATLAGICGCGTTVNTTERAQPVGQADMVDDKRVLTDSRLDVHARIRGVNQSMTAGGVLRVQVELFNDSRSRRSVSYHFDWFDQNMMQVETPATTALIPLVLEGKESRFISGVAPTPACKDFRLKLIRTY